MKKILISAPYMLREREIVEALLAPHGFNVVWANVRERLEEPELLELLPGVAGVICGDDRFTARVFERATDLKVVVKWGTGVDSIDAAAAERHGVRLFRTPGAFTEPVADTTLAYMLAFARNVSGNDEILKDGGWEKPPGFCLFERKVGIIGFGTIGKAVAKRLAAFGAEVLAHDRAPVEAAHGAILCEKERIFEECDFITLHCDLNPTSHHLLNAAAFARMKKRPYVINTARGPAVEEAALIEALRARNISGAGLDVFEQEPLALDNPLRKMKNVYLAAHNSNSSPSCWSRVHRNSVAMLAEGLKS